MFLCLFSGVRPSVCPYENLVNTKSQEPLGGFSSYLAQGCTMTSTVDELIRFWARSAQGQRSKVNELGLNMPILPSLTQNLKNPWGGFSSNLVQGCDTRAPLHKTIVSYHCFYDSLAYHQLYLP